MRKQVWSGLLVLALAAGLCRIPAGAVGKVTWNKEPASWAIEQMEDLADVGILGQGGYDPTFIMTRGQFCYFMVNLIHRTGDRDLLRETPPMPVGYFEDVESADGYGGRYNVYTAAAYGLTEGAMVDGKRMADLDNSLTREQAAKMMCSLLDALGHYAGIEEGTGAPRTFADADSISSWAKASVDRASALGILKGDEAGRFDPQGVLTFQEACVMLDRAFRQAEEAAAARDKERGIENLISHAGEEADWSLGDATTEMYWLERGGERSALIIHGESHEKPGIWVESFDARGNSTGLKEIPIELEFYAGFYEGEEAYYLAFGQNNMEEDDGKEVYRIVRYDKSWNRLGSASVKGGESYTTQPYRSTSHVAMAEENGILILHTSRLRYLTARDGLRHQSNITIKVRTSDMSVVSVSPPFPGNHVSHSFAQYVAFDGGEPVYADHGDAYPRGFALNWDAPTGNGKELNFFPFSGEIGDNTTNAYPGGLGISADCYLFAGASSDQKGNDKQTYCNVFLATVSKAGYPDDSRVNVRWLTQFPKDGKEYVTAVRLVPMNENTFVVMWQSIGEDPRTAVGGIGDFHYAVFNGAGDQVGETRKAENFAMPLNDPTVLGDTIAWVRPEMGPYGVFMNSRSRYLKRYELKLDLNGVSGETEKPMETPKPTETLRPVETQKPTQTPAPDPVKPGKPAEPGPASTVLPEDGITDSFCVNQGGGRWLKLEMVDGDTIRLTGCMPDLPDHYNYVVLQAYKKQAELPLTLGETFSLEVTIDAREFNQRYQEGDIYYVTAMVCQNHKPGSGNLAGISFGGPRVSLRPDGAGGCTFWVME